MTEKQLIFQKMDTDNFKYISGSAFILTENGRAGRKTRWEEQLPAENRRKE